MFRRSRQANHTGWFSGLVSGEMHSPITIRLRHSDGFSPSSPPIACDSYRVQRALHAQMRTSCGHDVTNNKVRQELFLIFYLLRTHVPNSQQAFIDEYRLDLQTDSSIMFENRCKKRTATLFCGTDFALIMRHGNYYFKLFKISLAKYNFIL